MARAFLVVMDSLGIGGAPDAGDFGDAGANTVLHISQAMKGELHTPNLDALGLGAALRLANGAYVSGAFAKPNGLWGAATEVSPGKDTPSGHWELAGLPVPWDWHYFPKAEPAFPEDLARAAAEAAGTGGILGNCHASGTEIIARLGAEHMKSGWPICYTSADSVFQIAAHEETFGLDRLLTLCETLAPRLHAMKVGRVIARPFTGTPATGFTRTVNRHDYAIEPPGPTLCDWVSDAGRPVHAIGKIRDIFSGRGITDVATGTDAHLMEALYAAAAEAEEGSLTFANFVEFDSLYGHRRDPEGYGHALEWFDGMLPGFFAGLRDGDLAVFTADHGNDPTWAGTDHTRERVPVLAWGAGRGEIGVCAFADVGASVAAHLGVPSDGPGRSFLP